VVKFYAAALYNRNMLLRSNRKFNKAVSGENFC